MGTEYGDGRLHGGMGGGDVGRRKRYRKDPTRTESSGWVFFGGNVRHGACRAEAMRPAASKTPVGVFPRGGSPPGFRYSLGAYWPARAPRAIWPMRLRPCNYGPRSAWTQYYLRRAFGLTASAAPTNSPQDRLLNGASAQGALALGQRSHRIPRGEHGGGFF